MADQSLVDLAFRTAYVFTTGYLITNTAIGIYDHLKAKYFAKKEDAPWNLGYPTFEFLVGRPEGSDAQLVHDTIRRYLDTQPITATCTITDATCMYNGKFGTTEPCHRVLLTFNPMRVDQDVAEQVAQDLATYLAKELKQFVVPGYEYRTARVFKGIGNIPTE
jgi:hypothetical protein